MPARGGGLLVQGSAGQRGNFEVVVPRVGGGFWHFWRNNDVPTHPWHGPDMAMGSEDDVSAVMVIEDSLRPGELVSVRREGNRLRCAARGHVNVHGVVRPRWGASDELPGGSVAAGAPGFVQSVGIHGNFEVVAPFATGALAHWWRDNGIAARPWHGPTGFGDGTFSAAALIQNDNGHLEVIAVQGSHLVHFWRDAGPHVARSDGDRRRYGLRSAGLHPGGRRHLPGGRWTRSLSGAAARCEPVTGARTIERPAARGCGPVARGPGCSVVMQPQRGEQRLTALRSCPEAGRSRSGCRPRAAPSAPAQRATPRRRSGEPC